jgi:hypothetical protein
MAVPRWILASRFLPSRTPAPFLLSLLCALAAVAGSSAAGDAVPPGPLGLSIDERLDRLVDPEVAYRVVVSSPVPVVPSPALPPGLGVERANNNLSIALHEGRLFLAFRTAPTHFASAKARLVVLSSPDLGRTWAYETSFATGRDLREPFLLEVNGRLRLYYAELGDRVYAFEPQALWRSSRCGAGCWTAPEKWGGPEEIAWDFKVRGGRAWMTSYRGKRYDVQTRPIEISFRTSIDGVDWTEVGPGPVYRGGATEASFEFDRQGALWAITRNEDGDATGFGSHVASAEPTTPGVWRFPDRSNPSRFDSPRLFRHGRDIYLVARRDLGPPAGTRFEALGGEWRKLLVWVSYSLQPKRTALYRLDPVARRFELVLDLPSAGDTAFPSVVRLSPDEFLVANYSSAFRHADRTWLWGQLNGTGIYFVRLRFEPLAANGRPDSPSGSEASATAAGPVLAAASPAVDFDEDWPARENLPGRMAGVGAVSLGALIVVRRWRRLSQIGRPPLPPSSPAA